MIYRDSRRARERRAREDGLARDGAGGDDAVGAVESGASGGGGGGGGGWETRGGVWPTASRPRIKVESGTGRAVHARPFVIRVNLPGIMKQKSSSDMSVSSESGPRAGAMVSGVSIVEMERIAGGGRAERSRGSNANPFSVNVGTFDGPRPMFRPSTAVPARAAAGMETPNGTKPKSGRPSCGDAATAEALAMMMNAEYPRDYPKRRAV